MPSEEKAVVKQIEDAVSTFTDPLIVYPGGWEDTLPEWVKPRITIERMVQNMKGEEGVATDAEAVAYLYTANLAQPVRSEWVNIYTYLVGKEMGDRLPEDMRREGLSRNEERLLLEFKRWLWDTRVKGRKDRQRRERAEKKAEVAAQAPKQFGLPLG